MDITGPISGIRPHIRPLSAPAAPSAPYPALIGPCGPIGPYPGSLKGRLRNNEKLDEIQKGKEYDYIQNKLNYIQNILNYIQNT